MADGKNRLCGIPLSLLKETLELGPPPLFATLSGSHLYGFPSPDSDVDLRGAFVAPLREILSLRGFRDTLTVERRETRPVVDWVAHDLGKFAGLMTRRNGYVLEQLYSPLVVWGGSWLGELRSIGTGCIVRNLFHHYRGFASNQRRGLTEGRGTAKGLLYAYRVLLTGIHVLRSGRIEADLTRLNELWRCPGLDSLMEQKRAEHGRTLLGEGLLQSHLVQLDKLELEMETAFQDSALPDEVTCWPALDDYLYRARLKFGMDAGGTEGPVRET